MYTVLITVDRNVTQTFQLEVDADNEEEAQEVAYDYVIPPSDLPPPKRALKTVETINSTEVETVSVVRKKTVAEKVFNDDDGDESA